MLYHSTLLPSHEHDENDQERQLDSSTFDPLRCHRVPGADEAKTCVLEVSAIRGPFPQWRRTGVALRPLPEVRFFPVTESNLFDMLPLPIKVTEHARVERGLCSLHARCPKARIPEPILSFIGCRSAEPLVAAHLAYVLVACRRPRPIRCGLRLGDPTLKEQGPGVLTGQGLLLSARCHILLRLVASMPSSATHRVLVAGETASLIHSPY